MAKKTHKLKNIHIKKTGKIINARLDVDMRRVEQNLNDAQFALDSAVMTSMEPFMPLNGTGTFISRTKAESASLAGSGVVVAAAAPYGQFLYEGKTMVDEKTGSAYARKYAKKVLVSQFGGKTNARENLQYARHSAEAHWFEKAKELYGDEWVEVVRRSMGKK